MRGDFPLPTQRLSKGVRVSVRRVGDLISTNFPLDLAGRASWLALGTPKFYSRSGLCSDLMVVAEKPFNKWSLRDKSGGNAAAIRLSATLDVRPDAPPLNPRAGRGTWRGPDLRGSRGFLRGVDGGFKGAFMQGSYSQAEIAIVKREVGFIREFRWVVILSRSHMEVY